MTRLDDDAKTRGYIVQLLNGIQCENNWDLEVVLLKESDVVLLANITVRPR